MDSVLKKVLKSVTPTGAERKHLQGVVDRVLYATDDVIKEHKLDRTLAGSFTRDTWLSHKKEFDVFILFPESWPREKLEKIGLEVGKKIVQKVNGSFVVSYAEHPYVKATVDGYDVDIVPCYKVKSASEIKSAVDRTPFHNEFVNKHLDHKSAPEVRLLKKFCKSIGVYGSDLKTQGFSGYLCELLIIKFGSFSKLVKQVASYWQPGRILVDIEDIYKGDRREFLHQPVIVIDPVDHKRNVAAAVSPAKFVKFVKSCEEFMKKPSEGIFFLKEASVSEKELNKLFEKRGTKLFLISFQRPDVVDDILYPQCRKTAKRVSDILRDFEFAVLGQDVYVDEKNCYILLELEVWELPNIRRVIGPPVFALEHSKQFLGKYQRLGRVWVEAEYWMAEINRDYKTAQDRINSMLSLKAEELKSRGIASHVADSVSKKYGLFEDENILKLAKDHGFGSFLLDHFKKSLL